MANLEDELKDLKVKNNELVQKVQFWKMTAAQREDEKLDLMKEINDLRLKLSRLRSNGSAQANNLDAALQSASEKALSHLVRASGEIARTMDLAKAYMRDRRELDAASPRWSSIGGTPKSVKKGRIHRVPPLMMGGQSIQPVVALTMLNTSNPRSVTRSPNQYRNVTQRAVPIHMLQDVYIPLTRIDASDVQTPNTETETEGNNANNSAEDLELDDSGERIVEASLHMSDDEDFESTQRLDAVTEDLEPEDEEVNPPRSRADNPLEGPSWMLDAGTNNQPSTSKSRTALEPDSTTEPEEGAHAPAPAPVVKNEDETNKKITNNEVAALPLVSCEFSPTVRRRKRTASPPPRRHEQFSPRGTSTRRNSTTTRVLSVVLSKMPEARGSPAKRAALEPYDAPSPNGATVPGLIVSEARLSDDSVASGEPAPRARARDAAASGRNDASHDDSRVVQSRSASRERDSDSSGEGRTRRARRVVTYKEKPLNRKMRR